ncbi:MAG TPA: EpsI family protein [Steroidobacter sp.]|uniref:exosortase C-terminal domain/associated protein EpsI n=1 Tax=Steroidobacter sp. TaxID=1978227 RepID=UPI002ED7A260
MTLSAQLPRLLIPVMLFAGVPVLFWPTTASLMHAWQDSDLATYTHGYLIVAVSVALLIHKCLQHGEAGFDAKADWRALLPLALLSVLWLVALRTGVQAAHQFLLPILMWLWLYVVLGRRTAVRSAFAFAYLYLAIPLWGATGDLLQWGTVHAVDFMLQVTGVPAYVHDNFVQLAVGTFEIAGGCSGLHFFIVALAIGALYGEVHRDTLATRLRVIALAVALALLSNWIRVYLIILAGHFTQMQHYLVRVEHYRFGWAVFAIVMVLFFILVRRFPVADSSAATSPQRDGESGALRPSAVALAFAALAIGPAWNSLAAATPAEIPEEDEILPAGAGTWSGPQAAADDERWTPVFAGADVQRSGRYADATSTVHAYAAAYAFQTQGKELVGYENSVLGPGNQRVLSSTRIEPHGALTELLLQDAEGRQALLWYYYRIGKLQTNREAIAQAWYGIASLASIPPSRVVALRAACVPDCDSARASLNSLLRQVDF